MGVCLLVVNGIDYAFVIEIVKMAVILSVSIRQPIIRKYKMMQSTLNFLLPSNGRRSTYEKGFNPDHESQQNLGPAPNIRSHIVRKTVRKSGRG